VSQPLPLSTNYRPGAQLGSTQPRLWTPPLRELTRVTSYGFEVIDFADQVLGEPLDPWQEWAAIHAGELLPDGRPRFRVVLILAARQNGKSQLGRAFAGYWLAIEQVPLVLGTSTDRSYAKRFWLAMGELFRSNPHLARLMGPRSIRLTLGEESLKTTKGAEYIFAANNGAAARSTTLHRWLCDELREHTSWDAWTSATNAMNAVPDAQVLVLTNQGDDTSVVLDSLRGAALTHLETGDGDPRLGLFEWSAPDGSAPDDPGALAAANPNLGRRVDPPALAGAALRAKLAGGTELTGHLTEVLCMRVHQYDPGLDLAAWTSSATTTPTDLAGHRQRVALAFDVALNGMSATAMVAAVIDGRVHVEVVGAWTGAGCTKALRTELPALVAKIRPRRVGWLPKGPAAVVAADLAERKGQRGWTPRGTRVQEITTETPAVCMGLADVVLQGELTHPDDPYLNGQVASAGKKWTGDQWVFTRRGDRSVDAVYALAGAVHLARTLPPPPPPLQVVRS
jgi:hypothetical protein